MRSISILHLFFALIMTVLILGGCGRKDESVPEKPVAAASGRPPALQEAPPPSEPATTLTDEGSTEPRSGGNRPPEIIAVPFRESRIHRGVDIEVMPEGLDPDGDFVTFRFEWFINGEKLSDFDEPTLPGGQFRKGDLIALRIVPSDGKMEGSPFTAQPFTVPNAPPRFISAPPSQFQSQNYVYEARAEDPDEEALTYHLEAGPAGMAVDADTGVVSWSISQDQAGDHTVRLVAQDMEGLQSVQEYSVTIRIENQEEN